MREVGGFDGGELGGTGTEYQAEESRKQRLEDIESEIKTLYQDFRRVAREIKANCDKLSGIGDCPGTGKGQVAGHESRDSQNCVRSVKRVERHGLSIRKDGD